MELIKKTIDGKKHYKMERYDNVSELATVTRNREVRDIWREKRAEMNFEKKHHFYNVSSYEEAYRYLGEGWEAPTSKMTAVIEKIAKQGTHCKTKTYNDIIGFQPNVPLAILNVPTSMINSKKISLKNKVIHIVYDAGISCGVDCEDAFKAGLNLFETVLNLEMSGYRVELDALDATCVGRVYSFLCVNIKKANQPMNIKKMMFPICNPAFPRVIGFDWMDKCEFTEYSDGRGYPYYVEIESGRVKRTELSSLLGDNAYYINYKDAFNGKEYLQNLIQQGVINNKGENK